MSQFFYDRIAYEAASVPPAIVVFWSDELMGGMGEAGAG
jgi:hypothetical protein